MRSTPSDVERLALAQIDFNIANAITFLAGMRFEDFRDDLKTFYAVTRALEIISEASRKLSSDLKERHPDIPWRNMAAAGNVYRHDYEDVIQQFVWNTVREALPPLLVVVRAEMMPGEQGPDAR